MAFVRTSSIALACSSVNFSSSGSTLAEHPAQVTQSHPVDVTVGWSVWFGSGAAVELEPAETTDHGEGGGSDQADDQQCTFRRFMARSTLAVRDRTRLTRPSRPRPTKHRRSTAPARSPRRPRQRTGDRDCHPIVIPGVPVGLPAEFGRD